MRKIILISVFAVFASICFGVYFLFSHNSIVSKVSPFVKSASVHVSNAVGNELGDDKKITNKEYIESLNAGIDEIEKGIHSVKMFATEDNQKEIDSTVSYLQACRSYLKTLRDVNKELMGFEMNMALYDSRTKELLGTILDMAEYKRKAHSYFDFMLKITSSQDGYANAVPAIADATSSLKKEIARINELVSIKALVDPSRLDGVYKMHASNIAKEGQIASRIEKSFMFQHKIDMAGIKAETVVLKRGIALKRRLTEEEAQKVWFKVVAEKLKEDGIVK